ncbi:unnamed protein product [Miscanthus lutarioriparius]|uniref:Uncharacterized protein n=1 Tax=Miscanthus lutarioriparius TaxID=422564 RepID=A0A811RSE3_9POAL|nr:unnamed protein product [Miscanthus lutarioriparius]
MAARSFSVDLAAAVFLFVVLFASPAQCRRGLLDQVGSPMRYPSDNATTTAVVNSTALDGSKFTVIFCVLRLCGKRDCYCCETGDYCYYSRKQCQANCDSCDPKCPPPRLPLQ